MYSPIETSMTDDVKETDTTATPPSTPTKTSFFEPNQNSNGKYSKTPQVAADLYKRFDTIIFNHLCFFVVIFLVNYYF